MWIACKTTKFYLAAMLLHNESKKCLVTGLQPETLLRVVIGEIIDLK